MPSVGPAYGEGDEGMRLRKLGFKSRKWLLMLIGAASGIRWPIADEPMRGVVDAKGMLVYDLRKKGHRS